MATGLSQRPEKGGRQHPTSATSPEVYFTCDY